MTGRAATLPDVAAALEVLRGGGLVAFPSETVWGIAADATQPSALARLYAYKGRDAARPVALLVEDAAALGELGAELGPAALRWIDAFWPGPLTLVLRCRPRLPAGVAGPDGAVGVRCSPHPVAHALAAAARAAAIGPLTATSLNRSGEPPAATRAQAERACADGDDAPLLLAAPGPDAGGSEPSSVVDATGDAPRLLREGALSWRALQAALAERCCA